MEWKNWVTDQFVLLSLLNLTEWSLLYMELLLPTSPPLDLSYCKRHIQEKATCTLCWYRSQQPKLFSHVPVTSLALGGPQPCSHTVELPAFQPQADCRLLCCKGCARYQITSSPLFSVLIIAGGLSGIIYGTPAQPEYSDRNQHMKSVAILMFFSRKQLSLCVQIYFSFTQLL